ncbi:MAG: hypothetical protein DSZ28_04295 [Thiothrix sp.]|nr:MAG: hypothetical protein DSZ28_04295 [Thiothrix sp.]
MTLKAIIYKAELQITDMDRHYYQSHSITLARHPSENEERMMVRLLAFCSHADENLSFSGGLSTENEPELWKKNLQGDIDLWIDLGQMDEKRIRKACARADQVIIYTYQQRSALVWWENIREKIQRFDNLRIFHLQDSTVKNLAKMAQRNMQIQCTIEDENIWLTDTEISIEVDFSA